MNRAERSFERRSAERRNSRRPAAADESFFGAFGFEDDTQVRDDEPAHDDAPAPGQTAPRESAARPTADKSGDSRFLSGTAARVVESGQTAFERIYRAFIAARAALGAALVAALAVGGLFGLRPNVAVTMVSAAYAALAIGMWALPRYRRPAAPVALAHLRGAQWLATIGVDLLCFTALHVLAPGSSLNYVALLVLPVLMAGMLTPRTLALSTAAAVTLALLGAAWLTVLAGAEGTLQMTQAGLAGAGFFVITVLANELAGRLAREELSARGSLEMARQQAPLNRLVIEEMQDGVLVVDRRGRVRAANPAARRLLAPSGMSRPAPFQLRGVQAWDALVKAVERAFGEAAWPEAGRDVALQFDSAASNARAAQRTLRVRVRFTRKREPKVIEEFCAVSRRRAQHAGAQPPGKAGGDGACFGRHRPRDPQPAGGDFAGQRTAVGGRDRPRPAPAHAHGQRQRRASQAHRR